MNKKSQVPEGYRKTEVGIAPEDWSIEKLGSLCELITKGTTPTTLGFSYQNTGINFIKIESISANGNFLPNLFSHISEDANRALKRSILKENDLLFSIAGALGRVAVVSPDILPANTNQALAIIRLRRDQKIDLNYMYFFLKGSQIQKHIDRINVQSAQANLSLENINNFKIALPQKEEQQKIASILSKVDEQIEKTEQVIEKTELLKKGLMQYFFNPTNMKKWSEVKFKDVIIKLKRGHSLSTNSDGRGVIYLTSGYLKDDFIDWSQKKYLDTEKPLDNCLLEVNDLILNCVNSLERIGKVALFEGYKEKAVVGFNNFAIKFDVVKVDPKYAKYYCLRPQFQNILKNISKPAVQQVSFSGKDLQRLHIQFPNLEEQQKIASVLSKVDSHIQDNQNYLTRLRELKKGLMQDLLTGKIRVCV